MSKFITIPREAYEAMQKALAESKKQIETFNENFLDSSAPEEVFDAANEFFCESMTAYEHICLAQDLSLGEGELKHRLLPRVQFVWDADGVRELPDIRGRYNATPEQRLESQKCYNAHMGKQPHLTVVKL